MVKEYRTDTVYVDKPAPVLKLEQPPVAAKKMQIYTKPDTARRQTMEAGPLISGLKLTPRQLEVQTLSPEGVGAVSFFPLKNTPVSAITVNAEGQVNIEVDEEELRKQKRRKVWQKIGNGAITVAAFLLGVMATR